MNVATIDIGTNTVLLLAASVGPDGRIATVLEEQRIPRLGRGVDAAHQLHPDSMERVIVVLEEYRTLLTSFASKSVRVFGTSAVRDAANRDVLAALIAQRTGWTLEVLSGEEEALWTYRGAVSGLEKVGPATVVDIGGGSTEVTTGDGVRLQHAISLNVGSVRLTERLLRHAPALQEEVRALRSVLREELAHVVRPVIPTTLVAVAGTATTLALLAQGARSFSRDAVAGYVLSRTDVGQLAGRLLALPPEEILQMGDFMEGRHDILAAGAVILDEVMERLGADRVVVSERGVRYGIALQTAERRRAGTTTPA